MGTYTHEMADHSIALGHLVGDRARVEEQIQDGVQVARDLGMTWAMVGLALGVSTQAAWERYGLSPYEKAERSRLNDAAASNWSQELPLEGLPEPRKPARLRSGWSPA